jgi:hypothetical protein
MTPMVQEVFNEHKLPAESGRRVLENVPTLGWGRHRECTFLGALEAALAPTEHPFSYTDMMGWTGMAFRTRWFAGNEGARWCPSCAVGEMEEEITAAAKSTGWPLRFAFVEKDNAESLARLTAEFVVSINAGRPVLAYEPRLNMDVVFGYEDGGKTLLLRDYFDSETPLRLAPSELGFLTIFVGEYTQRMPGPEAFAMALETAVRNWGRVKFSEGPGGYWYGEAALARWRDDLGMVEEFTEEERKFLCFVSWWNFTSMCDARRAAATFLRERAGLAPDKGQAVLRAADLYQQEADLLDTAFANRNAFTNDSENWPREMRERERELLAQAGEIEAKAISEIAAVQTTV